MNVEAGFRLDHLEVYNWGTFTDRVWSFEQGCRNGLLTGDIGSGKSTIVDAITTLLLPAQRISYNKAAGADTRERDLRSYILGYYKSERDEVAGTSKPVPLRKAGSFSVLLAVFTDPVTEANVTLAQFFWFKDLGRAGQPDRFYVTFGGALSITGDFADFGTDVAVLKRRLRKAGADVNDGFPPYGKCFRRLLGIDSEQAMELFHQTISMKSVANLNEFVRHHMLEPLDAAKTLDDLVTHFEDLTAAHDAVVRAREQLMQLNPLLADCTEYDKRTVAIAELHARRDALPYYLAGRKQAVLNTVLDVLGRELDDLTSQQKLAKERVDELRADQDRLKLTQAGLGGNRLAEIGREVKRFDDQRDTQRERASLFAELLTEAALEPVSDAVQFAARHREVAQRITTVESKKADCHNSLSEIGFVLRGVENESAEVNAELRSLRERPSNIPVRQLELRHRMCEEIGIAETELPYAGELIQVGTQHIVWEGAAERLLHGFGLSLLVATEHYAAVSDWIDTNHLGGRVVYFKIAAGNPVDRSGPLEDEALFTKLEIKESPFEDWLDRELRHRANYSCVDSMTEFRRAHLAITKSGQIKGGRGRHEKDDRFRIGDRRNYVLGWSNQGKIDALLAAAANLERERQRLVKAQTTSKTELSQLEATATALGKIDLFREFSEIDWQATARRIADLEAERAELEKSSVELRRISQQLIEIGKQLSAADETAARLTGQIAVTEKEIVDARNLLSATEALLEEPVCAEHRLVFGELDTATKRLPLDTVAACDAAHTRLLTDLAQRTETHVKEQRAATNRAVTKMATFRNAYPLETAELDNTIESAAGYRELHQRLAGDDLPRFEERFKTYLNTNTIRDIAGFHAQLEKQTSQIKDRVAIINGSLHDIDYNPGRYIRLEAQQTNNLDVRDFKTQLRECTSGALNTDDDQYSEQRFLQVKALIERFRGREGYTDIDRAWTRRVTDVRNWFVFAASERNREDDSEHENYTDSDGKSGGQKEKLAYTILAASLAYQFKLDSPDSMRTFRFVVIDEAFGRGSDESTRYGLGLFGRLGLQLLIVTPLQKIHVIEPFVAAVGFVDNKSGGYSRIQTLTIQEYRQRRLAHLAADTARSGST
jgi:uncharacterized protein YPO0396